MADSPEDGGAEQSEPTVDIKITSTRGSHTFTFAKTTKVEEVIAVAVDHFGLSRDRDFSLMEEGTSDSIQPERTLVSLKVEDGDEFILTGEGTNVRNPI